MGKDWDKAVPSVEIWKECLRVLKSGAFMFVMSSPRQDVLSQMVIRLAQAEFDTGFTSVYWTYASGFPKAMNIGKAVDKKLGAEREIVGRYTHPRSSEQGKEIDNSWGEKSLDNKLEGYVTQGDDSRTLEERLQITEPATNEAKTLDGSYGGFQPKPAVEIIIICMKPLSEKTYVDQALKNGKGVTWLDDVRIPYQSKEDIGDPDRGKGYPMLDPKKGWNPNQIVNDVTIGEKGRFPANLLVSDDVLNDGRITEGTGGAHSGAKGTREIVGGYGFDRIEIQRANDIGSFSRYFDLDKWFEKTVENLPEEVKKTFPFLSCPKASKSERNQGCDSLELSEERITPMAGRGQEGLKCRKCGKWKHSGNPCRCTEPDFEQVAFNRPINKNVHPTVKPLKLMSYLVTLGSRPDGVVLDPFMGSGTTGIACAMLNRNFIGIEINEEYFKIAEKRIGEAKLQTKLGGSL